MGLRLTLEFLTIATQMIISNNQMECIHSNETKYYPRYIIYISDSL